MQTVIKKTTPEEWQIQAWLYQQKRKDGYRAIATVMIQWEYAKRQEQTQPYTAFLPPHDSTSLLYQLYIFQVDGGGASRLAHCQKTMHLKYLLIVQLPTLSFAVVEGDGIDLRQGC